MYTPLHRQNGSTIKNTLTFKETDIANHETFTEESLVIVHHVIVYIGHTPH